MSQLAAGLIHDVVSIVCHQLLEGGRATVQADGAHRSSCGGSYRGAGVCKALQEGQQRQPQQAAIQ